jgi:hypothetical protein
LSSVSGVWRFGAVADGGDGTTRRRKRVERCRIRIGRW